MLLTQQTPPRIKAVEDVLAAMALALVWLAPNHQLPWGAFHHELLMAVALGIGCWLAIGQGYWKFPLSPALVGLLLLACLPWLQWGAGVLPLSGQAWMASAYVAGVAIAFALGHAGAVAGGERLLKILFGALVLGAALNVPIQVIQWFQWYSDEMDSALMIIVTPINSAQRPSGLILQPNQLATIQVWGLVALTWLRYRSHVGWVVFLATFAFIGIGLGLTQSRAGLLELLVVAVLFTWAFHRSGWRGLAWTWWLMLAVQLIWAANFAQVVDWLDVPTAAEARLSSIDGARLDAWRAFMGAIGERPWTGYGIGDVGYAYSTLASERPEIFIGQRFAHAHNIVIDLLLWVGVPLALLIMLACSVWGGRCLRACVPHRQLVFPVAVLLSMGVHAMLELPHHFLYFLVPAAICAGWLHASVARHVWMRGRAVWTIAGSAILAMSAVVSYEYFPYQERYTEWRFEHSRVGHRPDVEIKPPLLLNQIYDEMALYRLQYDASLTLERLKWVDAAAAAVASPPGYYAAAKANGILGRFDEARDWMMRYNATMGDEHVKVAQAIWQRDQKLHPELAGLTWPDYGGRGRTAQLSTDYVLPSLGLPDTPQGVVQSVPN